MTAENNSVSDKPLRHFGFVLGALIAGIFGLLWPWLHDMPFPLWPWIIAAVVVVLAALKPSALGYVNKTWLRIGGLLGYINTRIMLFLMFYLIIAPIGVTMRLFGKSNSYRFDPTLTTYKKPSEKRPMNHLEKPY